MHRYSAVLLAMLLLLTASTAHGRIAASFHLDMSAWEATDIVVASEGEAIDGTFTVTEVWAGELKVGDTLRLPSMAEFKTEESRTVKPFWGVKPKAGEPPQVLSADRVVLFLKREAELAETEDADADAGDAKQAPPVKWVPATFWNELRVSAAWLHGDKAYAFTQVINPGPAILTDQGMTPKQFKDRAIAVAGARQQLDAIAEIDDAEARVQAALAHIESDLYRAAGKAFELLGESGPAAVPALRAILDDPDKRRLYPATVKALTDAGGQAVANDLIAIVNQELVFWQQTAPNLEQGWWNGKGLEWDDVRLLRDRYSYVLQVFYALQELKPPQCRPAVEAFRDYWRSMPQLEDKAGLTQMSEACDKVLKDLPEIKRNFT